MGEGKWIKTYVNTYDDTPSKMIDAHENRDCIHYVRGRLFALAGKVNRNGELYMTETKPYTIKTLAIEFNRDFEMVNEAIKVLKNLEVIKITEDRVFKISDWEIDQNIEGLERIRKQTNERVARHRAAKKADEDKKIEVPKKSEEDNKESYEESKQESKENSNQENKPDAKIDGISESNDACNNKTENNVSCDDEKLNNIKEKLSEKDNNLGDNIINNTDSENVVHSTNEIIDRSDVTKNNDLKGNVTVTPQNKKEKRNKKKNKKQRESKKKENKSLIEFSCESNDFEISDDNSEDLFSESFVTEDSNFDDYMGSDDATTIFYVSESYVVDNGIVTGFNSSEEIQDNHSEDSAKLLLKYCEDIGNMPVNITLNALTYAINNHTKKYVKMAIDKSVECGKFDMAYINGILKNWKREGYPIKDENEGRNINGANSYGKSISSDTIKFEGFKPKKPRELTEEERRHTEENLI